MVDPSFPQLCPDVIGVPTIKGGVLEIVEPIIFTSPSPIIFIYSESGQPFFPAVLLNMVLSEYNLNTPFSVT